MTIGPAMPVPSPVATLPTSAVAGSTNQPVGTAGGAQTGIVDCVVPPLPPETVKRIAALGPIPAKMPTGVSPLLVSPMGLPALGKAFAEVPDPAGPEDVKMILNLTGSMDAAGDQKWLEEHMGKYGESIRFAPFYHDFAEAFKGESNADRLLESSLLGVDSFINGAGLVDDMTHAEKAEAMLTYIRLFPSKNPFPRDRFSREFQGLNQVIHQDSSKVLDFSFGKTRYKLDLTPPPTPMTGIEAVREYDELTKRIRQAPGRDDGTEHLFDRQYPEQALWVINSYLHHDPVRTGEYKTLLELVGHPTDALALSECLVKMDNVARFEATTVLRKELMEWRQERLDANDQEFCLRYYTNCRESEGQSTAFPRKILVEQANRLNVVAAGRAEHESLGEANERYRRLESGGLSTEAAATIFAQAFSRQGEGIPNLGTASDLQDELARLTRESVLVPSERQSELVESALRQRRPEQSLEDAFLHARVTWELFQDFSAGDRVVETVRAAMGKNDFGAITEEELVHTVEVRAMQHIVMGRAASEAVDMALDSVLKEQKAASRQGTDGAVAQDVPPTETSASGEPGIRIGGVWIPVRQD